jgi:hypothetical protein
VVLWHDSWGLEQAFGVPATTAVTARLDRRRNLRAMKGDVDDRDLEKKKTR